MSWAFATSSYNYAVIGGQAQLTSVAIAGVGGGGGRFCTRWKIVCVTLPAAAMDGAVRRYWSDVGYDPAHPERFDRSNDWARAVPTREVDMAAYRHDYFEIWFAGNPRMQARVDLDLHNLAIAASWQDTMRLRFDWAQVDRAIAAFAVAAGVYQGLQRPRPQQPSPQAITP